MGSETKTLEDFSRERTSAELSTTALCKCGSRDSAAVFVITTILFGQRTRWKCRQCGDIWWTLP